jgi:hypothetical protein
MKVFKVSAVAAILSFAAALGAVAQGPVATACKDDIAKLCAGKSHDGDIRACLEAAKAKVSATCRNALDTTGGGKGKGKGN